MNKINKVQKIMINLMALALLLLAVNSASAGSLTPAAAPADSASAMFTLEDLYNRLNLGTAGSKRSGAFAEPGSSPGSTMHNLNDIMSKAPAVDVSGAADGEVLTGRKYWGLTTGQWGPHVGTMPNVGAQNVMPTTASQTITQGYHDGTGKVAGDANLVTGNIRAGVNLFGVVGNSAVVNTASANATAGELLYTRTAWVNGQEITGTRLGGVTLKAGGTFSAGKRWYDNADGTITDVTTGLVWLKTLATATRTLTATVTTQIDCIRYCGSLQNGTSGLTDGSRLNDWRIPTSREMLSLMTGTEAIGNGNFQGFSLSTSYNYWTSSQDTLDPACAITININTGIITGKHKLSFGVNAIWGLVWPVRNAFIP